MHFLELCQGSGLTTKILSRCLSVRMLLFACLDGYILHVQGCYSIVQNKVARKGIHLSSNEAVEQNLVMYHWYLLS